MKRVDKRRVAASIVIGAAALQAVFAAAAFFARGSAERSLQTERSRCEELEVRIEMAESTVGNTDAATEAAWQLADAPDVSGTLQLIQGLGDDAGVELTRLEAKKSTTDGKQTFQITGSAAPAKVCEFVASIEQSERLVVVETGRILPGTEAAVIFDLGLATYHATRGEAGQ